MDPFYKGPRAPRRERRVTEIPPSEQRVLTATAGEVADEVYDALAKVANKAQAIFEAVEPHAARLWIPVHSAAERVRGAVRRKSQGSSGDRISFDLFKDAIETMERRRDAVKVENFEDLTGNALADDQAIRLVLGKADHEDLSQQQVLMMLSGLMVLLTLNRMMAPYQSVDMQQVVAGKLPPGTEIGPLVNQTIIGIVYQLIVAGLEESVITDFLHRSGVEQTLNLSIPDVLARARSQGEQDELTGLAERAMGEGDYELILEYAFDYISRTHEPGYEMWMAYHDSRRVREKAMTHWRSSPLYSPRQALRTQRVELGVETITGTEAEDALSLAILDSIVPAEVEYMCALRDQSTRMDETLNVIGQVVASRFSQDALCCVGQFLSLKDVEWIGRARQVLSIFMGVQGNIRQLDFSRVLSSFVNFLDERIREELIDSIHRIVHKIADPVLEPLEVEYTNEEWAGLYSCPLIRDLVETLLLSIDLIGTQLGDLIGEVTVDWEVQFGQPVRDRWQVMHTRRKVRLLLDTLDQTLHALESGILCMNEQGEFLEEDLRTFVTGLPNLPHVDLDPVSIQRFFLDTKPIELPGTVQGTVVGVLPPMNDPVIRAGMSADGNVEEPDSMRHCRELFQAILDEKERS